MKHAMAMVTAIALTASAAGAHSLKEFEAELVQREAFVEIALRPAPPFRLVDTAGRAVSLADFKGKVVVLNFIYTFCPDVCPLHSAQIAGLQAQINRTAMRDLVQFISITTDPQRDSPQVMRDYGVSHGLDSANWRFLTSADGRPRATRTLARDYGLKFTTGDGGYLLHGVVTHVIDKSGNLRARYHGLKVDPLNIILHINALTNDFH